MRRAPPVINPLRTGRTRSNDPNARCAIDGSLLEALFNRALALEALHLDGARAAWQAYIDRDSASAWAEEARDRLSKLSAKPQGSIRPSSDAAIRAALDPGTPCD